MERTTAAYKWKDQVRGYPDQFDRNNPQVQAAVSSAAAICFRSLNKASQEAYRLFRTFAGAVFIHHGYTTLRDWMVALDPV